MYDKLKKLYGSHADTLLAKIEQLIDTRRIDRPQRPLTEQEVVLITYGDSIRTDGEPPLETLHHFLRDRLPTECSAVHILPCFPFTSDDGFSVSDYRRIDPRLGSWADLERMSTDVSLMLDAVINHASVGGEWFQRFLAGEPPYCDYFLTADPQGDYSAVIRPRTSPLLTPFDTARGRLYVWTTFSADQADLDYRCPALLLEILDILALYAGKGARFIRLDAVGFLYKERGSSCMHLEQTHLLIQLMRQFLEAVAPGTMLITETNVPHRDNISYFGDGNEAQMVYQFPLPPLVLHAFQSQTADCLLRWADSLAPPPPGTAFFNFLASHDGVGMRPTEGLLTDAQREQMAARAIASGGFASYKDNGDGSKSLYELNINYLDALCLPDESQAVHTAKMLGAHAILLSLAGVPAIYIHSLLGSHGDREGASTSNIPRRINREKLSLDRLTEELASGVRPVFAPLCRMLRIRRAQRAFSPDASQQVLFYDPRIFALLREHPETGERLLALINVSAESVSLETGVTGYDLLTQTPYGESLRLEAFGVRWMLLDVQSPAPHPARSGKEQPNAV